MHEHMLRNTNLNTIFLQWHEDNQIRRKESIRDDDLLELAGDLCKFIFEEVIHTMGRYHDPESMIGSVA